MIKTPNGRKLSYTGLKHFKKSPMHYMYYLNNPIQEDTDALLLGSAVDVMLLTPEDFKTKFVIYDKFEKRSNEAKLVWELMCQYSNGKFDTPIPKELKSTDLALEKAIALLHEMHSEYLGTIGRFKKKKLITFDMHETAKRMTDRLMVNVQSREIIDQLTFTQLELDFVDPKTKIPCKGFIDGGCDNFLMDLKTSRSAYPQQFHRDIINMEYHLQAHLYSYAMYLKTKKWPESFYWVTIDNCEPYGISVNRASKEMMAYGKQEVELLMQKFAICCKENLWNEDYDFHSVLGTFTVELPYYLRNKLSE